MSQFVNMGSETYYHSHNFYGWNAATSQPSPAGPAVDPNSLLFSQPPPNISPSASPTNTPSLVTDTHLDPGYTYNTTTYNYYAPTPQSFTASPCSNNLLHQYYPSPASSVHQVGWSQNEQDTTYTSPYHTEYRPYQFLPAGPSQHAGTVQPAAIFGKPELRDESYPQTTLGTPDTSARATPSNEPKGHDNHKRLLVSSTLQYGATHPIASSLSSQSLLSAEPSEDERLAADESSMEQFEDHGPAVTEPQAGPSRKGTEKRKRTRTAQACEPCRKRKAKCSGCAPGSKCGRCIQKRIDCVFIVADKPSKQPVNVQVTASSSSSPPKKRKRQIVVDRNYQPTKPDHLQLGDAEQVYQRLMDKNLLQLQLDGPASYTPQGPYGYSQTPQLGVISSTSSFEALGYMSTNLDSYPNANPYLYNPANITIDGGSAVPSLNTPSDVSYDSSPSRFEIALTSPYDTMPYGSNPQDGYFPATMAYPSSEYGNQM